eukprot:TRINITY_DN3710_c0_g1_i1.p1 TRINITY_DN3710_c0_g1~~TRINITY_DN3710_c0_g1_i1.p1  ORF type:complete len:361 (+),score=26.54 TRINITY_DN3710_c0_g1_i1:25-1107(+)
MLQVGICHGISSSVKALILKKYLTQNGILSYLLSEHCESQLKLILRQTWIVVILLDEEWWKSSRGCYEINEIHHSSQMYGKPLRMVTAILQEGCYFPSKNLERYRNNGQVPSQYLMNSIEISQHELSYKMFPKMKCYSDVSYREKIENEYPQLRDLKRMSVALIDGINYPDTFVVDVLNVIGKANLDIFDESSRTHIRLQRHSGSDSGTLQIKTRDLLLRNPSIRTPISVWTIALDLIEFNHDFLDIIGLKSCHEIQNGTYFSGLHQMNFEVRMAVHRMIFQLNHQPMVHDKCWYRVHIDKGEIEAKSTNITIKAIRDSDGSLTGFIMFMSIADVDMAGTTKSHSHAQPDGTASAPSLTG